MGTKPLASDANPEGTSAHVTVWTFEDSDGRAHLALPIIELEREEGRFTLALSTGSGLVALRHVGDTRVPVTDPRLVARLADDLRAVQGQGYTPVLVFEATGPDGLATRFIARGAVAHLGHGYLVAEDRGGATCVFRIAGSPGGIPTLVVDAGMTEEILRIAMRGTESSNQGHAMGDDPVGGHRSSHASKDASPSSPLRFRLMLPGGRTHTVESVRQLTLEGMTYILAVDIDEPGRAYALRTTDTDDIVPVDDPDIIDRLRAALQHEG